MEFFQLILYTISGGMFYALLSVGFGFTLRSVKFFNFSYGGAFLVGGYMMFLFYRTLNISFIPSLLLSLLASGLYSLLSYQFIFKTLINQKAKSLVLLIASLGLLTATGAVLGMLFGSQATLIARHLSDISIVNIFNARLNIIQTIGGFVCIPLVILILAYIRYKTRFGRAIRAVEDDVEVAELVGIPKDKTLLKIFFISGILAGLAGMMEGLDNGIIPTSGLIFMLPTVVATVIGGMQSFWGGILGAFILVIIQQLTIVLFGGNWVQAVPFVILIVVLWFRPTGILKR